MLDILRRQQYKDGIGRDLLDTIPSASKSGSLDRLRSDVGIVYTRRGRIAMAITVDDMEAVRYVPDNQGLLLIWRLSQILQDVWRNKLMNESAVILVSGGMDSCVTAAIAKRENQEIAFLHVSYDSAPNGASGKRSTTSRIFTKSKNGSTFRLNICRESAAHL
jgi:hypothetical protein